MMSSKILYHFYDLDHAAPTFNALVQFVSAEIARVEATNCDAIRTIFVPGFQEGFNTTKEYDLETKRMRFWSILLPSLKLISSNKSFIVLDNRDEAKELLEKADGPVFPFGYELDRSSDCCQMHTSTLNAYLGYKAPTIRPPRRAVEFVKKLINRVCPGQKFVTLTARGSTHLTQRNSSQETLNKVANYMQQNGYFVFFLPDYDVAMEVQDSFVSGAYLCREAAVDLTFRAALYELASLNIGEGGCMTLCCFNDRCNYIFGNLRWSHRGRDSETALREELFASGKGVNYHNTFARWLWSLDDPDETIDACSDFINYSRGEAVDINKNTESLDEVLELLSSMFGHDTADRIRSDYLNRANGPLFVNREYERKQTRTMKYVLRRPDMEILADY
ncbi:MAG: hypothetical protein RIF37_07480 [Rhodospirillaceae bacterium]